MDQQRIEYLNKGNLEQFLHTFKKLEEGKRRASYNAIDKIRDQRLNEIEREFFTKTRHLRNSSINARLLPIRPTSISDKGNGSLTPIYSYDCKTMADAIAILNQYSAFIIPSKKPFSIDGEETNLILGYEKPDLVEHYSKSPSFSYNLNFSENESREYQLNIQSMVKTMHGDTQVSINIEEPLNFYAIDLLEEPWVIDETNGFKKDVIRSIMRRNDSNGKPFLKSIEILPDKGFHIVREIFEKLSFPKDKIQTEAEGMSFDEVDKALLPMEGRFYEKREKSKLLAKHQVEERHKEDLHRCNQNMIKLGLGEGDPLVSDIPDVTYSIATERSLRGDYEWVISLHQNCETLDEAVELIRSNSSKKDSAYSVRITQEKGEPPLLEMLLPSSPSSYKTIISVKEPLPIELFDYFTVETKEGQKTQAYPTRNMYKTFGKESFEKLSPLSGSKKGEPIIYQIFHTGSVEGFLKKIQKGFCEKQNLFHAITDRLFMS